MNISKNKFGTNILVVSMAMSGLFSITAGAVLNKYRVTEKNEYVVKVVEKSTAKKTEIKLKEIIIEENMPLSVEIKDYIENIDQFNNNDLAKYKLDTSLVNVAQSGTYTYTITYKDKKYNGTVIVKSKMQNTINNLTLKEIKIEKGKDLSQNVQDYIVEVIPAEELGNLKLNLANVNKDVSGTYQYTIAYKDRTFTNVVTVYEPMPTVNNNEPKTSKEDSQ